MRLSMRLRLSALAVLASCLLLLMAFVGTASAFTVNPHITAVPHHVVTDSFGCAAVTITGKGFTESTATHTNPAILSLGDADFDGDAVFATTGQSFIFVPVNAEGKFTLHTLICDDDILPGGTFSIGGRDGFGFGTGTGTGLTSNTVLIRAD